MYTLEVETQNRYNITDTTDKIVNTSTILEKQSKNQEKLT